MIKQRIRRPPYRRIDAVANRLFDCFHSLLIIIISQKLCNIQAHLLKCVTVDPCDVLP